MFELIDTVESLLDDGVGEEQNMSLESRQRLAGRGVSWLLLMTPEPESLSVKRGRLVNRGTLKPSLRGEAFRAVVLHSCQLGYGLW